MRVHWLLTAALLLAQAPAIAQETAIDDSVYSQKGFELSAILYGVIEIGGKSCKSTGDQMASSLDGWWNAVGSYQAGEANLGTTLSKHQQDLKQKIDKLSSDKSAEKQVDLYQVNIESIDASIESIAGANGRIALRKNLLTAVDEAIKKIEKEHEENVSFYNNMTQKAYDQVMAEAKAGCERKKTVSECTTDASGVESCTTVEKKDPVSGCDVAQEKYPELQEGAFKKYKELYFSQAPSEELNTKMGKLEATMKSTLKEIPPSDDANFDWTTPMEKAIAETIKSRKNSGIICPNSAGSGDMPGKVSAGAKSFLSSIGTTDLSSDVTSTFTSSWNTADTVVGQPGLRPAYFSYVKERIGELISMDEAYLSRAVSTRKKYTDYAADVKAATGSGGGSVTNPGSNSGSSTTPKTTDIKAIGIKDGSAAGNGSNLNSPLALGSYTTIDSNTASVGSSTIGKDQAKSTATLSKTAGGDLGAMAVEQSELKIIRNDKAAQGGRKLVAPSTSESKIASSENGKSGSKKDSASVSSRFTRSNDKKLDQVSKLVSEKIDSNFKKLSEVEGIKEVYKAASYHSSGLNQGYETTAYDSNNSDAAKVVKSKYKNTYQPITLQRSNAKSAVEIVKTSRSRAKAHSADEEVLSQAIKAKKMKKRDLYEATADDSLFGLVTKAYIRSYEKVGVDYEEEEQ